jgi:UDP-glucose 4-epimerase
MRALLTGVSSFTGCWFASALAEAGWDVLCTCRQRLDAYAGMDVRRLAQARHAGCELVGETAFGDARFLDLVARQRFDLLCHHGVEVGDFRRDGFDPIGVLSAATLHADRVLQLLARGGARAVIVTGSMFEPEEGGSSDHSPAVNAYGVAKRLIWEELRHGARRHGLVAARFVVPHPFGPLDKPGLVDHLLRAWRAGQAASIDHPHLVRDFIHVDFLSAVYAAFCGELLRGRAARSLAPSGCVGTILAQARRLSAEMAPRLGVVCRVEPRTPPRASNEPLLRINTDPMPALAANWPFARSWDRLAEFYL